MRLLGDVDMAFLDRKKNSPYWFVQFIDSSGKRRNKSTELRTDNPCETTQAREIRAQFEAKELMRSGAVEGDGWWIEIHRDPERQTGLYG